ncbi:MAG: xanthine dehydrogenase family protein molybdopterin-binding subunit [Clostridia bacterium]|nr:xanthine dehydrogenase family protein molybdopterin-binding subunit [Clostridia bacterium]
MNRDYQFIGKETPRKDAGELVRGKAKFIDDLKMPGMLHAKILRSPHPHAIIKEIDVKRAKEYPGVKAVLTYKDAPDWKSGLPRHVGVLDQKVRYVGDAVALVAAETEAAALDAMELIEVQYELLKAVFDVEEAIKPDAPQLYSQFPGNSFPLACPWMGENSLQGVFMGDVEKGFAASDIIVEGSCSYDHIPNPLPLEPPGVIVNWEGSEDLTVWSSTQSPYLLKLILQYTMGRINVRSIAAHCGGSFGTKAMPWHLVFYAAALAKAAGRSVKLFYTKEEHFAAYTLRLGSRFTGKIGIKKDGTVMAVSGDWNINTGFCSDASQGMVAVGCGELQLMVRCANWDLKPKLVCTNRNASKMVRGYGGQELESAFLPVLNLALEKANIDPFEFFKKNYIKPGDGYYWRDGKWWVARSANYDTAMDKGAAAFGWKEKWQGWLQPTNVNGAKRTGIGVGVHGNADVGEDVSEAYVRLDPDGTAVVFSCVSETGTGLRSNLCKMAAEVLKLPMEKVSLSPPDTLINPYEFGPVGSRGTYAIGSAVIRAAEDARKKLLEHAALHFNTEPEELDTADGLIFAKGANGKKARWKAALGAERTCMGYGRFEPDFTVPNFLMLFVEVEVDTETGKIEVLRVLTATDVGQVIDPQGLINQMHGSLGSAGLDSALFEESILDKKLGRILNPNMVDYKWRTFLELPAFDTVIEETPVETNRFKAIGVGEIATSPGPPAVLMAVSNALGIRFKEYPLTPDKILNALGKGKKKNSEVTR